MTTKDQPSTPFSQRGYGLLLELQVTAMLTTTTITATNSPLLPLNWERDDRDGTTSDVKVIMTDKDEPSAPATVAASDCSQGGYRVLLQLQMTMTMTITAATNHCSQVETEDYWERDDSDVMVSRQLGQDIMTVGHVLDNFFISFLT